MKLLKDFFKLQQEIFDYFGYVEDWVVIPLEDETDMYWCLVGETEDGDGDEVIYAEKPITSELLDRGEYYSAEVYTQRFLPKWVYRKKEYTMICADTGCDGNKFLMVFDNSKECKEIT